MRKNFWKATLFAPLLALSLISGAQPAAAAATCSIEAAPAATLLLPYFEVDLGRSNGANTVFTINNASNLAVLAHVTLWTDLSIPTLDFNVYLTGYDAQAIDLRQLFNGVIPPTASAGQDPTDTVSPQGDFSQDVDFTSCNAQLPLPALPTFLLTHLRNSHTGQASALYGNLCTGRNLGDRIARGYITVDTVNNCTLRFPTDFGYFGEGGDATDQNVLFGEVRYINQREKKAQEENLVHIQASASDARTSTPGNYTFYGRYVNWSADDHREPLPTNFATRYESFVGVEDPTTTDLIVWRDSKVVASAFSCGSQPAWYPLSQEGVAVFDDQENADVLLSSPLSPAPPGFSTPFPAEAQITRVDSPSLPAVFDRGWMYLNLNTNVAAAGANPPADPNASQAWVMYRTDINGRFRVGGDAIQLDNACAANHAGVESGGAVQP